LRFVSERKELTIHVVPVDPHSLPHDPEILRQMRPS
jgi:hypothetical protein